MKIILFLSVLIISTSSYPNDLILPSIFSDNMVLQQKAEVAFWGKTVSENRINISTSWGVTAETVASKDGSWITRIKTPKAGGPYQITIQSGDTSIIYKNVLIGEVWICSGQSNMEMPLEGWPPKDTIINSKEEIKNAYNTKIRFFTVNRAVSYKTEFNVTGEWKVCDSVTAAKFSATAYFFGKKLYEKLKVPIGLINTSWGGTPIETWTSDKYLRETRTFDSTLDKIISSREEIRKQRQWIENHPVIDISKRDLETKWQNLEFDDSLCSKPDFNDTNWRIMNLPTYWEITEVGNFDGVVWFRKRVKIPEAWVNKDLVLELGTVDDMDRTYVNGIIVGRTEKAGYWQQDRIYNIPGEIIKDTLLTIAVRVLDNQGGGGIYGDKAKMKIHPPGDSTCVSIADDWKYLPVAEFIGGKFYVYGSRGGEYYLRPVIPVEISEYTPSILYNAMIAPLVSYTIKGTIWYQGEENTKNPKLYNTLFPLMIKNWRNDWNLGNFPFYYVQIAPYNYGNTRFSELLREAQFKTLSVTNTGMAVTMDIGNPQNIHPGNKKDVGDRLAFWALVKTYNKKLSYSGPLFKSMRIQKNKITLSFEYASGGLLVTPLNGENNFMIAGEDKVFKKASVIVKGNKLIVFNSDVISPVAVRYAWSNVAEATLFNKKGLPASSFRTDDWND
jgi:sialate O-acetylesterase